jgi:hypothetical protein
MRHATILVAILAFTPLASATAQVSIRPGERVRVTHLWGKSVGTFLAWKSDTLVFQSNGDTLSVPAGLVTRLDVRRGRKTNTGKGAGIGFVLGSFTGAAILLATYEECVPRGAWSCIGPDFGSGFAAATGALIGGLGGVLFGAIIGSAIKTDRWREVPLHRLRVSLAPQRDERFGLGLSVEF